MRSDKREHILIAVPSLNYSVSPAIAHLFAMAQRQNSEQTRFIYSCTTVEGVHGHDYVRNTIARLVLEKDDIDRVWMIDDDIVPNPAVFGLVEIDTDIIAPLMPTLKWSLTEDNFHFNVAYAAGRYRDMDDRTSSMDFDIKSGSVVDVHMVGTGCTLIRRRVLEDPGMHYAEKDEEGVPAIFKYHRNVNGSYRSGEDEDFCIRAKKLGYDIKLHTGIEVGHMENIDIGLILRMKEYYRMLHLPKEGPERLVANAI